MSGRPTRGRQPLPLLVLAVALLGACNDAISSSPPATNRPVGPSPVVTSFPLGTTVWVSGFVVTVVDATASLDAKGGPVVVRLQIENPGREAAALEAPIRLTASGSAFDPVHGTTLPAVPGFGIADVSIQFEVTGRATIADGVLRIGRTADHQVQVPFGPGPVQQVTLQPFITALKASASSPSFKVALGRAIRRWDLPDWHDELPLGVALLFVEYDITYTGTFTGGASFTPANVALKLPDGRLVAPRADGRSQSILLLRPRKTVQDAFSRFEIPDGMTGKFALVIKDEGKETPVPFTIGP